LGSRLHKRHVWLLSLVCPVLWQSCARTITFSVSAPVVQSVSPSSGPATGGTQITLKGTGFTFNSLVTVNGRTCTDLERVSETSLVCVTPELTGGASSSTPVDVVVTNVNLINGALAEGTLAGGFTYLPLTPLVVTGILPVDGAVSGGNQVTISGTGFNLTSVVKINGKACTDLEHVASTSLVCVAPSLTGGTIVSVTVDVTVTNRDFESGEVTVGTLDDGYTYHPPPTVTASTQGFFMGGSTVTITGTGFRSGATVTIGGSSCTGVTVLSGTSLSCVAPAGTALASADVVVTNTDGQDDTLTNGFTWRQVAFSSFVDGNGTDGIAKDATKDGSLPRLAEFSSKLYMTWQESDGTATQVRVAKYNDNDSSAAFAFVDGDTATGLNYKTGKNAANPQLLVYNSKLYNVWDEIHTSNSKNQVRVREYSGDDTSPTWSFIDGAGDGGINLDTTRSASTPSAVATAGNMFVAFSESNGSAITQIRVKKYNGTAWSQFDVSNAEIGLNANPVKNATTPSIAYLAGRLYLVWKEPNNSNVDSIRAYCNEDEITSSWVSIDNNTSLNRQSARHAKQPRLTVFNNKIYATWVEEASGGGAYQTRIARFDGASCASSSWVFVDGNAAATGINRDSTRSAQFPMLSVLSSFLYATWAESDGSATNIRIRQLSNEGSGTWTFVEGTVTGGYLVSGGASGLNKSTARNANNPFAISHNSKFYNAWQETNGTNTTIRFRLGN
jgi:hypothetical protein